ncbi:MAG: restriction endonuclease, partial [Thiobacillus sp.]|nr:restriction endonuclease [Thiobacillus sp.]
ITKRAFKQLIGSRINERLRGAMTPDIPVAKAVQETTVTEAESEAASVETTLQEIEGFHIVRAILRDLVPTRRVYMRDAQSYCAVLFDDNNRKPICRLRFNNEERLVLGLMNGKDEEKVALADLDELYNYADRIKSAAAAYM